MSDPPRGLRVVRSEPRLLAAGYRDNARIERGSVDVHFRALGFGGRVLTLITVGWCGMAGAVLVFAKGLVPMLVLQVFVGIALVAAVLASLKNGFTLTIDGDAIQVRQQLGVLTVIERRLALGDIKRIFLQRNIVTVAEVSVNGVEQPIQRAIYEIFAEVTSGGDVLLVTQIEKPEVASYLETLCAQELLRMTSAEALP